eukprot:3864527-Heterocapsa_arctica.AAC.1
MRREKGPLLLQQQKRRIHGGGASIPCWHLAGRRRGTNMAACAAAVPGGTAVTHYTPTRA